MSARKVVTLHVQHEYLTGPKGAQQWVWLDARVDAFPSMEHAVGFLHGVQAQIRAGARFIRNARIVERTIVTRERVIP